jgi:hypothetical protein
MNIKNYNIENYHWETTEKVERKSVGTCTNESRDRIGKDTRGTITVEKNVQRRPCKMTHHGGNINR